jgi:hypothetical protein
MLLLTALVACGITIWQLWREVVPMRAEVANLRQDAGILTIDDDTQVHAIRVPTDHEHVWKWRVFVPIGKKVTLLRKWGSVPRQGVPEGGFPQSLEAGEQLVSLSIKKTTSGDEWIGELRTTREVSTDPINEKDLNFLKPNESTQLVLANSITDQNGRLVLERLRLHRYDEPGSLDDDVLPGFIIWLEQQ